MKTVLIVEDSLPMIIALETILAKEGYEVHQADHGEQALNLLESGLLPDLVIADLNMPVMDGLEFLQQFRQKYRGIPVLMLSLDDSVARREQARELGASGWLVKPVCSSMLHSALDRLLTEQGAEKACE